MKTTLKALALTLSILSGSLLNAQELDYDPDLKPFYHGVASGDPLSDGVIIWTRVTPEDNQLNRTIPVRWRMATDPAMTDIVHSGTELTDADRDFTVKVDVTGLLPATTYYYQFESIGATSMIGRTRTTPTEMAEQLRFAVVSCNNYQHGYFSGFAKIAERADLDAVIHLGDYIYEYGGEDSYGNQQLIASGVRAHLPAKEIVDLNEYRTRYSQYRLDPDLRRAHQQHPFITVWDDHESANDAYQDGAENHQPEEEGPWSTRKSISRQVYSEWMPVRGDLNSIPLYRTIKYGSLMDLIMLDTRLEDRVKQGMDVTSSELYSPEQTMLGSTQKAWMYEQLLNSEAKWKVIGNQVIFSPFNVWWAGLAPDSEATPLQLESLFLDIWDGYPTERDEIISFFADNALDNLVILTGDFHSSLAFDVTAQPSPLSGNDPSIAVAGQVPVPVTPTYNPATGEGAIAVEFATPSVTSANFDENIGAAAATGFEFQINKPLNVPGTPLNNVNPNPHLKFNDLDEHGYYVLDVQEGRIQANYYFLEDILVPDTDEFFAAGWGTNADISQLTEGEESPEKPNPPALAPDKSSQEDNFTLQILHASDLEGGVEAIDNAPNFAALVDLLEDDYANTLVLSGGDNYIPGPFYGAAGSGELRSVFQNVYQTIFNEPGLTNIREGSGRVDITIMNIIGFDASAVGNHEFDAGTNAYAGLVGTDIRGNTLGEVRWLGSQFPYLSANLNFSADPDLSALSTSDILATEAFVSSPDDLDAATAAPKIAPGAIAELNGERVGIVGATTQLLESLSSNGGVTVEGPDEEDMAALAGILQPTIDALTDQGINKIVLLTHLQQIALEKELISLLNGVDIIIAGGSDVLFAQEDDQLRPGDSPEDSYPFITQNASGETALIVGTDGEYSYLGRLIVEFDANGILLESSLMNMLSGAYATTTDVVSELWGATDPFLKGTKGELVQRLTQAVNEIVTAQDGNTFGLTEVYLEGRREQVRTEETNLGNLTADANLYVARQFDPSVQASIKNGGGIRAAIGEIMDLGGGEIAFAPPQSNSEAGKLEGEISQLDITNSLRFNNSLSLLTLSAADLKEVLEHAVSASTTGATPGQFPQVAGVKFSYDTTFLPGNRIQEVSLVGEDGNVVDEIVQGGDFQGDPERNIRIVTLNFLAGGGDNYPFPDLADDQVDLPEQMLPEGNATFAEAGTEQDALAEYLYDNFREMPYSQAESPVFADERIILLNAKEPEPELAVTEFILINARIDEDIIHLEDGDLLVLSELPRFQLNVRAEVQGEAQSLQFTLNGEQIQPQNAEPYSLFGDDEGDYRKGTFRPGSYMLKAIPYTERTAQGMDGVPLEISFEAVVRNTIADIVKRSEDFSQLLAALRRSGLLGKLAGPGPYTVFAPTDAAFEKLLEELEVRSVRHLSVDLLKEVLQYHVISGELLLSSDLSDGNKLKTLLGREVSISQQGNGTFVNDSQILAKDMMATNGVVHVIEDVLLPDQAPAMTIAELAATTPELSTLYLALQKTDLLSTLKGEGPFSIFAPTNEAFRKVERLLGISTVEKIPAFLLKRLLLYHVVPGAFTSEDLNDGQELMTAINLPLSVEKNEGHIFINNAVVSAPDLKASNGVVHLLDDVILPDLDAILFGLEAFLPTENNSPPVEDAGKRVMEVRASPNPGAREVSISTHGLSGNKLSVTIMNYQGLKNRTLEFDINDVDEEITIDLSSYAAGMYIIHTQVNQIEKTIKVVRQ